jgi:sugar phosphate isomerase/epimerase
MNRLSMNHKTVNSWTVPELVDGCVRAGIEAVGLWREPVAETGLTRTAKLIVDAGLRVSSLCRGGFFNAPDFEAALDDNRRAIDEAAALGAPTLVLVVGGLPAGSKDLVGARGRVADALAALGPHAVAAGVRLGIEPLHPMFCADRAVVSTLGQALDLAEAVPGVGVVVDTYHVWWDPQVEAQIARAADRIVSYQVCDWLTPLPADVLLGRGVMGDGHIDFAPLTAAVAAAGYSGDIEVEIFNADLWAEDPATVTARIISSYQQHFVG